MNKILKGSISLLLLMLCIDSSAYASGSIVKSTGKLVVDSNTVVQVNQKLTIEKGDNNSTDQDKATGTIHNHNEISVNSGGSIEGDGQIVNYLRVETDTAAQKDSGNLANAAYDEFVTRGIGASSTEDFKKLDRAKITGDGSSDVKVKVVNRNDFDQTATVAENSYYVGDIADHGGLNAVHKSEAKDEVKGSFHSLRGYTEYTNESEVPKGATTFKHGYSGTGSTYKPVYIPKVDDRLVVTKTAPEGTKLNAYETELKNELETSRKEGSFKFADWTANDPVTTYSGDNSWYNGVFKQERGAVIVPETAAMFGGRAELGKVPEGYASAAEYHAAFDNEATKEAALAKAKEVAPTEFEWQGGPKDEYNRPDIYMNGNSSLYFNLNDKSPIFSFYGNLHGTEYDRMIIEKGTILWKGDGSDYKGSVGIVQGSKFEVRSSDATSSSEYVGKFPNAKLYQIDDHGDLVTNPTSASTIDTAGIDNVTVNNGHMILKNDSGDGVLKMTSTDLEKGSFVELEGKSDIKDVTVKGVAVAKGDVKAENVTISGGVFAVEGSIETTNMEAGSTIVLWGNDKADRNIKIGGPREAGDLTITDKHTLKVYADLDPASNTSDCINTQSNTIVNSGNGVQIGGINFISDPTQNSQTFTILTGAAAKSTPISIGAVYDETARATFVAYQKADFTTTTNASNTTPTGETGGTAIADTDIPYTYTTQKTPLATAPLNDGTGGYSIQINGTPFYIYGSDQAGHGMIILSQKRLNVSAADSFAIPVHAMHLTSMATVSQLFGLVSDDYGYRTKYQVGKFELWNKTFAGKDKFETNSSDIESIDYGTVFGLDTKPVVVGKSSSEFMGTIFGGVSRRNMETTFQTIKQKANQNTYFAGLKGTFFNNKYSLDLIASYQLAKTKAKYQNYSANIKSHLFSLGTKFGYAFDLTKTFTLRQNILVDYTFAKTPSYSVSTDGTTIARNMHRVNIVPELALNVDFGNWKTLVFISYHSRFGSKGIYEFRGTEYRDMTKKQHMEFGLGVNRISADNNSNISLKLSQKTGGVKGFKATVNVGLKC